MSRRYVVTREVDGKREYAVGNGRDGTIWSKAIRDAHTYMLNELPNRLGVDEVVRPLRPKGAPRRDDLVTRSFKEAAGILEKAEAERDVARAEVAVIRSERDQMQGRWETARDEVERITAEACRITIERDDAKRELLFARQEARAEVERLTKERDDAREELASARRLERSWHSQFHEAHRLLMEVAKERDERVATLEAEVFSLENRLRRQDGPTDGAMFSGKSEAVNTLDEAYLRIDELEKQVSAVKGQSRAAQAERDAAVEHARNVVNGVNTAVANARRAAIEECAKVCDEPTHLPAHAVRECLQSRIRALLTTPTADDVKGEAK